MASNEALERLARIAVDCGYHIHRELGPGLLESVYEIVMLDSLRRRGLAVERQVPIAINYNGRSFDNGFKADLLIEDQLLLELKSTERHAAVHAKQLLTYLRLTDLPLGLLMNFGMATFKQGVHRIGNDYFLPKQ
jgi:iron complex transport system substrate-binding protein